MAEQQACIRLVSATTRTLFFILLMKYLLSEAFYKRLVYQSASGRMKVAQQFTAGIKS